MKIKKLQRVEVAFRESERCFRAIFNQTFGFIGLMEPIEILMEVPQTTLKFGGIISSKIIRRLLWPDCCPDFSRDIQYLTSIPLL